MNALSLILPLALLGNPFAAPVQPGDDALQSCVAYKHGEVILAAAEPTSLIVDNADAPADLLGNWSWTTISNVGYRNTTTGMLSAPSGMSAKFTFLPGGKYKFFFYVRQQTYSLVTESTSTHEGTATFGDGTVVLHPARGHYKGHTGSRIIDRPMTAAERKPTTYYYEWRTENGKRVLYMGPTKASLSLFKRD